MPRGGTRGEAIVLRFRPRAGRKQDVRTSARHRRFDGLMTQMADRACLCGRIDVTVPDFSERRPDHQREKRDREHEAPDLFFIGHLCATPQRPCIHADLVSSRIVTSGHLALDTTLLGSSLRSETLPQTHSMRQYAFTFQRSQRGCLRFIRVE